MKHFSIIISSVIFALTLVSPVAAKYVIVPPDSILNYIFRVVKSLPDFMPLILVGLISFVLLSL
jgi:hypothetical protein